MNIESKHNWRITAVFILLLSFWLLVGSTVQKSPTVDEQSKLFRGAAYLTENSTHFLLGHPLLGSSVAALGTLLEPELNVGVEQPFWKTGNWSIAGDAFLWQLNADPIRLIFLGRLPIIFAALLLSSLLFHWATQLAGRQAGMVAMTLLLLDPNFIAHARLITGDLLLTAFFLMTMYGFWRIQQSPSRAGYLIAGLGLGLASSTKFNAAILLPILTALTFYFCYTKKSWRPLRHLAIVVTLGGLTIVAFYRFALRPLPAGPFWEDLFWVLDYFGDDHGAYLFGRTSPTGWWYYFPVAFLLKTPLPTLLLFLTAFVKRTYDLRARRCESTFPNPQSPTPNPQPPTPNPQPPIPNPQIFLLLPPLIYLIFAMTSALNIGYRHLLPMLPFLFLFTAVTLNHQTKNKAALTKFIDVPLIWLIITAIWVYPNYIPFFNLAAGGSQNGWRLLSDSNVDWGQDLPALAQWQDDNQVDSLFLSYFGTAHPSAYGIQFVPIPTWAPTPEQANPKRQVYNPFNPAPGIYAISVNHLHGVVLGPKRDFYAYFREQDPIEKIGNSIFIYEVKPNGEPIDVVFSGLRPSTLHEELQFDSNNLQIRWVDQNGAFLWPENGGWLLTEGESPLAEQLLMNTAVQIQDNQYKYELPSTQTLSWATDKRPLGNNITYLGADVVAISANEVQLMTAWQSTAPIPEPIQIFVHALDPNDQIIGQWDGIHSDITSWSSGDVFVQFHRFAISEGATFHRLATGLYNPISATRVGERIIIIEQE